MIYTPRIFSLSRFRFFNEANPRHPGWDVRPGQLVMTPNVFNKKQKPVLQWEFFCVRLMQETVLFEDLSGSKIYSLPLEQGESVGLADLELESGMVPEPYGLFSRSIGYREFLAHGVEPLMFPSWGCSEEQPYYRGLSKLQPFLVKLRSELEKDDPSIYVSELGDEGIPRFWFVPSVPGRALPENVRSLVLEGPVRLFDLHRSAHVSAYRLKSNPIYRGGAGSGVIPWSALSHGSVMCGLPPETDWRNGQYLPPETEPAGWDPSVWRARPFAHAGDGGDFPQMILRADQTLADTTVEFA